MKVGAMLGGHGPRSQSAVDEFATFAQALPAWLPPDWETEHGYLEFANPVIRVRLDRLRAVCSEKIVAVPGMLFAAMHAKNDIPAVLNTYAAEHGITVSHGRELGVDPKMIAAAGARIMQAVDAANASDPVPLEETCLVVIGRGAAGPDANANVSKVARMLWEGLGSGWHEVGYSGVTFPLVEPCLSHVVKLGYRRVVVFPYFLFSGIQIDRIYGFTDQVAAAHPDIQFIKAPYLGDHPQVLEIFAERVTEQLAEVPPSDCAMCKYRVQMLGFEAEVGTPRESHHHHVDGQGASAPGSNVADCPLCADFCAGWSRSNRMATSATPARRSSTIMAAAMRTGIRPPGPRELCNEATSMAAIRTPGTRWGRRVRGSGGHDPVRRVWRRGGSLRREYLRSKEGRSLRPCPKDPAAIYAASFAIVRAEARLERFPGAMAEVAIRLIHACGAVGIADRLAFSPQAAEAGRAALAAGALVLCDCRMVATGIIAGGLPAGNDLLVMLNDPSVRELAARLGTTRSAAAFELWRGRIEGTVVAIGNAPTALFHLLERLDAGWPKSALILGFPVGFVGAAESKAELAANPRGCGFVALKSRRGGSALAAAAVNALAAGLPGEAMPTAGRDG